MLSILLFIIFFFQAEDGIRDGTVTGVQTCALPIWMWLTPETRRRQPHPAACRIAAAESGRAPDRAPARGFAASFRSRSLRSEERRVGKECRSRMSLYY